MDYVQELENVLTEDYTTLANEGDCVQLSFGSLLTVQVEEVGTGQWFKHKKVVTELPDGRHFAWQWEQCINGDMQSEGPATYGAPRLNEVTPAHDSRWVQPPLF